METTEQLLPSLHPIVTTLVINTSFMAHSLSIIMFRQGGFPNSLVALHSLIVISYLDDLRNTKGRPMSNVTLRIPFLSHLWQCNSVARLVATCHVLIGWILARSLMRHLVFPCLDFCKCFFLSSPLHISIFSSIPTFSPFLCFLLPLSLGRFALFFSGTTSFFFLPNFSSF